MFRNLTALSLSINTLAAQYALGGQSNIQRFKEHKEPCAHVTADKEGECPFGRKEVGPQHADGDECQGGQTLKDPAEAHSPAPSGVAVGDQSETSVRSGRAVRALIFSERNHILTRNRARPPRASGTFYARGSRDFRR